MPIAPGTLLGPYEITAPLGAGGMGEVYQATDTRLGREVAVKVLPQHLSTNPEVRARFEREAKTVSNLNHPHICTLFDVGRAPGEAGSGDIDYLVMELVEGETLARRLERGSLPIPEVFRLGGQIADALDRAHRAGVIHRDLKPGNVMLARSGAKLMDFGLARAVDIAGPATGSGVTLAALSQSPTTAQPLTAEGTIVGTFQYMAPEQLEGSEADARSDLWALGCVLYEMVTGHRAFEGKSQASLIGAIMHSEAQPINALAPLTPPGLDRLVQACLAKDPADRLQSAHDIRMQLAWLAEGGSQAGVPAPVAARRRSRKRLAVALAAAGWLVAIAAIAWIALKAPRAEPPFFATITAPPGDPLVEFWLSGPIALSPDGTRLATVVRQEDGRRISVYDFRSGTTSVLESTQKAGYPFWSPDGRWIGFFSDHKLRKVAAAGGPAQPLADAFAGRGGTWDRAGVIVFAPDIKGPLMKVSENGGTPTAVTRPDSRNVTHRNPHFLPDGRRFLFIERSDSAGVGRLMVGSIDGATPREVLDQASNVVFSAGYLLFVRNQSLLAQRFDAGSLALRGPIMPIADKVDYFNARDMGNFSATSGGLLVFRHQEEGEGSLAWIGRDGRLIKTVGPKEAVLTQDSPSLSRDLKQAAIVRRESSGQTYDAWLLDTESGEMRRLTFTNTSMGMNCVLSPDGQRLAVETGKPGATTPASTSASGELWIQALSGAGTRETLLEKDTIGLVDWSPDGKSLLGESQRTATGMDIVFVRLDDPKHQVHDLVSTRFFEVGPRFSPDGAWVAYQSNESGRMEIYVTDFPDGTRKHQVSRDGGGSPVWSQDGHEIYFKSSAHLMAARVTHSEDGIKIGPPEQLAPLDTPVGGPYASDGQRFLVFQQDPTAGVPIQVVRNWPVLLAQEAR